MSITFLFCDIIVDLVPYLQNVDHIAMSLYQTSVCSEQEAVTVQLVTIDEEKAVKFVFLGLPGILALPCREHFYIHFSTLALFNVTGAAIFFIIVKLYDKK